MSHNKKFFYTIFLCISILIMSNPMSHAAAFSLDSFPFIILSQYDTTIDIGDEFHIGAITSTGKNPTWKSSDSKIASVNTYGIVTAKKSGSVVITAKIKDAEASCYVSVNKTKVTLSKSTAFIERGETLRLAATTSNGSPVTWKSSKKSVATIDENGKIMGIKPGETTITATADQSSVTCILTVKYPTIKLNQTSVVLYRGQTSKLSATVSSNVNPTWKTNKRSIAVVDNNGIVTAMKHGTAIITATVDGVSKTCEIVVEPPEITLSSTELALKKGDSTTLIATVSSNNPPTWSSSNTSVVTVSSKGVIKALQKGTAQIYATEDGTKVRCTIKVTE